MTKEEVIERRFDEQFYIFCAICGDGDEKHDIWYYNEDFDNGRGDYICKDCLDELFVILNDELTIKSLGKLWKKAQEKYQKLMKEEELD